VKGSAGDDWSGPSPQLQFAMARQANLSQGGFTPVELTVILVIVGIIAAVAVPRFFDRRDFDNLGDYDGFDANTATPSDVRNIANYRIGLPEPRTSVTVAQSALSGSAFIVPAAASNLITVTAPGTQPRRRRKIDDLR
jgi:hypothetical protein